MAFDRRGLADYVEVNERIVKFYEKYPDGSLQSEVIEHTESRVAVKAYAYRTADDARPGIGHSWLNIPGSTPYTRGSELENAETSAWGRALAALGFEVKRGIASREEVENKQAGVAQEGERLPRKQQGDGSTPPASSKSDLDEALPKLISADQAQDAEDTYNRLKELGHPVKELRDWLGDPVSWSQEMFSKRMAWAKKKIEELSKT